MTAAGPQEQESPERFTHGRKLFGPGYRQRKEDFAACMPSGSVARSAGAEQT